MQEEKSGWNEFIGKTVVVDTDSHFLYIGILRQIGAEFLILEDADIYDARAGASTKEAYIMNVKKFGLRPTRKKVSIRLVLVVSVSLLDDIIEY